MEGSSDYKDSFMKMASTAFSASKTGWTRAKQVKNENTMKIFLTRPTSKLEIASY